jgi:tetratricopeptide (TPR) repeat protein
MKKVFVALGIVALAFAGVSAQEGATTVVLLNYSTVKKKVEKSDADIQDPKKNIKAATWEKRGELFQDVFMLGLEQLQEGMNASTMQLFYKEPNNIETETKEGALHEIYVYDHMKYTFVNGSLQQWERIDPIVEDPLREAMDAYFKALELDDKHKLGDKIKEKLTELKDQLKREGVNDYYTGEYDEALDAFENVLEVNSLDLFAGEMDTIMIQYSGIISREIAGKTNDRELYQNAIDYYKQLAEVDFGGPNTYLQIKMDYLALGDTLGALEVMKEAFSKYTDTVNVIANIVDTYIQLKQFQEGLDFMAKAIEANPNIAESYYWNGRLLINMKEAEYIDKAIESYKKAGELNPNLYYVWYDMGYIFYLQGADFYDRASLEEHDPTRDKLLELGKEKYADAIPALEKAYSLNEENPTVKYDTLDLLQRIYYKEQMMDDYERVKALKETM